MPVALPASNTARFKLRYNDGFNEHALVMRANTSNAHTAAQALDAFLVAHGAVIAQITIVGLEYAPIGSDIFNPVTWDQSATYGTGTLAALERPYTYSYTGRSTGGHKCKVFLFANNVHGTGSWRIPTATGNFVEEALAALVTFSSCFLAIDGLVPVWHAYANQGANDHWMRKARG